MSEAIGVHSLPITSVFNGDFEDIRSYDDSRVDYSLRKLYRVGYNLEAEPESPGEKLSAVLPVYNYYGVGFYARVAVGEPRSKYMYKLLVDSGSANTWLGAGNTGYTETDKSKDTGNTFGLTYMSNEISAVKNDTVYLSNDSSLEIKEQLIGLSNKIKGYEGDGVLGIGPSELSAKTVTHTSIVPRVIDNLQEQETISTKIIRIAFAPTGEFPNPIPGVLTLGGTEKENYIGELKWVEIPAPIGNADLWGVEQTVTYDKETLLTGNALVDVGCTAIYFKEEAFEKYKKATGAVYNPEKNTLTVSLENYEKMKSLFFKIGGVDYEFNANAQIFPRLKKGDPITLVVRKLPKVGPKDPEVFINGFAFAQRFYVAHDPKRSTWGSIGIANTVYTKLADTN